MFPLPSPEERARLRSEQAHRFPELATLRLPGDGGAPVSLPIVLGNPTGTCKMPDGEKASPAWATLLRAALGLGRPAGDIAPTIVADCVLYPSPSEMGKAVARWPGLPKAVVDEVQHKLAAFDGALVEPWSGDEVPSAVAARLATNPRAAWFHFRPRDAIHQAVVIVPPESHIYRATGAALNKANADLWAQTRGLVERCTVLVVVERDAGWSEVPLGEVLDRFPGLAILLFGRINSLVGADARAELGEL